MTAPGDGRADAAGGRGLAAAAFMASAVVLALEVAHVRLLSYVTDPRLVYGAISVALAGLGAASILVAVRPSLAAGDVRLRVAWCAAALGAAVLASSVVLARISGTFSATSWTDVVTRALPVLVVCGAPYVPGGLAIALAVTGARRSMHGAYGAGLVGSALGCFALFPWMRAAGLEAQLAVLGAVAGLGGAWLAWRVRREAPSRAATTALAAGLAVAVVCGASAPFAERLMPFQPDAYDLLGVARAAYVRTHPGPDVTFRPVRDFARWDPVSRVEVFTFPGNFGTLNGTVPIKLVTQDGGAGTILVGFGDDDDARAAWAARSVYGAGYLLRPDARRVLIVGMGGGVDVVTALHHGATDVTAVEINASTVEAATRRFAAFQGHVLARPGVRVVHGDGRSFLERAQLRGERYALIQMSGADTYSAGAAGAFMFSESYLYTVDAFKRYIRALDDDGVLALIRFGPEPLRAVISEAIALGELGYRHPERHIVVLRQGVCAAIVLAKRPITPAQLARVRAGLAGSARGSQVSLPMWEAMGFGINEPLRLEYAPGLTPGSPYDVALQTVAANSRSRFQALLDALPMDFSPTTDDRPFFFQFLKPRDWLRLGSIGDRNFWALGLLGHVRLVTGFLVLAAFLTLVPPLVARRRQARGAFPGWAAAYFGALGAAYMFVELALIQRTVLLLGHPTWSVSALLAALLLGSGAGSFAAGSPRLAARPARTVALAVFAIAALVGLYELALPTLVAWLLPAPLAVRAAALVALVAPLGVAMGVPFPTGLRAAERAQGAGLVAWALGVNGFAGVLASLVAVPAAMVGGFRAVLAVAVALYALAAVTARGWKQAS